MQETERVTSSGAARGSHVQLSEVQLYFNTFILSKAVSVCVCRMSRSRSQGTEEAQLKEGRSGEGAPCNAFIAIHTQVKQTVFRTPTVTISQPLQSESQPW